MRLEDRGRNLWATFTADMQRYAGTRARPWSLGFLRKLGGATYEHPGLLAIVVYRYGQWVCFRCKMPIVRQLLDLPYYYGFFWVRTRLQIELPRSTCIDAGLRIDHFGSILVNCQFIAGKNLTITHGVLIGQTDTGVPRCGDNVAIGAGAKVIGGITLGDSVQVGAGAVVTKSFPDNAVIAGVPARLLRFRAPAPGSQANRTDADADSPEEDTIPEPLSATG
jgi:serine O-acetyltransferase